MPDQGGHGGDSVEPKTIESRSSGVRRMPGASLICPYFWSRPASLRWAANRAARHKHAVQGPNRGDHGGCGFEPWTALMGLIRNGRLESGRSPEGGSFGWLRL